MPSSRRVGSARAAAHLGHHRLLDRRPSPPGSRGCGPPIRGRGGPASPGCAARSSSWSARAGARAAGRGAASPVGPEDRPHHHLEGDRPASAARARTARRRGQAAISRRATSAIISASAAIACAVEGGQHQLAALVMCSGSSSSITERGPSTGPSSGLASVDADRAAGGEDRFHVGRVGEDHPVAPVADPQGEGVAVAAPAALQPGQRPPRPAERLQGPRQPRPGRQRLIGRVPPVCGREPLHQLVLGPAGGGDQQLEEAGGEVAPAGRPRRRARGSARGRS